MKENLYWDACYSNEIIMFKNIFPHVITNK